MFSFLQKKKTPTAPVEQGRLSASGGKVSAKTKGLLEEARIAKQEADRASGFGSLVKNSIKAVPKAAVNSAKEMGQASLRGFGAVGAKIAAGKLNAKFTPQGRFQEDLYGTKDAVDFSTLGKEVTGRNIPLVNPVLGGFFATADAIPGGQTAKKEVKAGVEALSKMDDIARAGKLALGDAKKAASIRLAGQDAKIAKGVVEGNPLETLRNVEARMGVKPVVNEVKLPASIPEVANFTNPKPVTNRVNIKLEQRALEAPTFQDFYNRSGVTHESLDATAKNKGFDSAVDFYNATVKEGPEVIDRLKGKLPTPPEGFLDEAARAKVEAFRTKAEGQLSRPVLLTADEKRTIAGVPQKGVLSPRVLKAPARISQGESLGSMRPTNQGNGPKMPSFSEMVEKIPTPVNKKVGWHDYLRTPDRVLKKIGLEKEATVIRNQYDKYLDELPKNIDKITEWSKKISPEGNQRIFKTLDGQVVLDLTPEEREVAGEVRNWLENWAERLKLPKHQRIANYITHIFDDQLIKKEFDEDLAKIIAEKVPGSVYDPFLQKRLGAMGYIEDTWKALDAYAKRATRKVHMDPALELLEEGASGLEQSQWEYVKKYADKLNLRPSDFDNKFDNTFKQIFGYRAGQRPMANLSRTLRQTTFRGMLGGNIGSAVRNISQGVNTYSKLGEKHTALGYIKLMTNGMEELKREGILRDNIIQDRALSATKKTMEKLDKGLFYFFDTAEKINRGAAYYGAKSKALAKGMNERDAIEAAKKLVRDTQFLYGNVDTPLLMQGDMAKILTQFMTYPVKQTEFLTEMARNKDFAGLARYAIGGLAFTYSLGKLLGMEPKEFIPWADYLSGDRKLGAPPSLKLPWEVVRAAVDAPDQYGGDRDMGEKAGDIGKALWGVVPGGAQINKSIKGINAVNAGGSFTKSGNLQYEIEKTPINQARGLLFGKYSLPASKEYYNEKETETDFDKAKKEIAQANNEAKIEMRPFYNQVQALVKEGKTDEARQMVNSLSEEDYKIYKKLKDSEKSRATTKGVSGMYDTVMEVQKLKNEGKVAEARALVSQLSNEEYKWYKSAKSQLGF